MNLDMDDATIVPMEVAARILAPAAAAECVDYDFTDGKCFVYQE